MKSNIGPHSKFVDRRPWQKASAKGKKDGKDVEVEKEWLVDTGGELSCITEDNAKKFDLKANAAIGDGSTVAGKAVAKDGLTMKFRYLDADGNEKVQECALTVYVVDNRLPEILGNDQIAKFKLGVAWSPKTKAGKIFEKPPVDPSNLRGNPATPGTRRPGQAGTAKGLKGDAPVTKDKEWLIDTGADRSVLTPANAANFTLTDAPDGGKKGVTMTFEVFDEEGKAKKVECSLPVDIKDTSLNIIGMDQLAEVGAEIVWDPDKQKGRLYKPKAGTELKQEKCFIATAAYGTELAPEVQFLRELRDEVLRKTEWGEDFFERYWRHYYRFSPPIAREMEQDTELRDLVRWSIVEPWSAYMRLLVDRPDWGQLDLDALDPSLRTFLMQMRDSMEAWLGGIELPRDFAGLSPSEAADQLNVILTYVKRTGGLAFLSELVEDGGLPIRCDTEEERELIADRLRRGGRSEAEIRLILEGR